MCYIDDICVWYEKPLFIARSSGLNCNSSTVIPHKTLSYVDTPATPEELSADFSTLKNFPNKQSNAIQWSNYYLFS